MESLSVEQASLPLIHELLRSPLCPKQIELALKDFEGKGYISRFCRNVARNAVFPLHRLESPSCPEESRREQITRMLDQPISKKGYISLEERAEICTALKSCPGSLEQLLQQSNKLLEEQPLNPPLLSDCTDTFALRDEYKIALNSVGVITIIRNQDASKPFMLSTEASLDSVAKQLADLEISGILPFLEHVQVPNELPGRSAEQTLVAGSEIILDDCSFPRNVIL